jgi:hypothetical protein
MKIKTETQNQPILTSQRIAQVCLFLFAFIGIFGGTLQMFLGEPDTSPRLDNIHRFLAGVYLACGFISLWTALTIKKQDTLIFLLALGGLLGATGRLVSMNVVGLPEPNSVWIGYLSSEIIIPIIMIFAQLKTNQKLKGTK